MPRPGTRLPVPRSPTATCRSTASSSPSRRPGCRWTGGRRASSSSGTNASAPNGRSPTGPTGGPPHPARSKRWRTPSEVVAILQRASPEDRTAVYQELCVRLDYDPHLVKAAGDLARVAGRVGGACWPTRTRRHRPRPRPRRLTRSLARVSTGCRARIEAPGPTRRASPRRDVRPLPGQAWPAEG